MVVGKIAQDDVNDFLENNNDSSETSMAASDSDVETMNQRTSQLMKSKITASDNDKKGTRYNAQGMLNIKQNQNESGSDNWIS